MTRVNLLLGTLCLLLLASPAAAAETLTVGGRVLLPWGEPLAEAELRLDTMAPGVERLRRELADETVEPAARARTDARGRFKIEAPHPGLWVLRAEAPGFVPVEYELKPLIEPVELPDATMTTDTGLTVSVSDAGGPLAGARVMARESRMRFAFLEQSEWKPAPRIAVTGDDGKAVLPRGEGEQVNVTASHPGLRLAERRSHSGTSVRFDLEGGESRPLEVRSASGEPVAGVLVALGARAHPVGTTDDAGRIAIVVDESRPTECVLFAEDGRRLQTRLEAGDWKKDKPRTLQLPERIAIAGRLIDTETRRAIPAGVVWDGGNPTEGFVTDDGGGFVLFGPEGARLRVQAGATGYLRGGGMEFQLASDGRPGPTIALAPAAAIEGRVVDADGNAVSGAAIELEAQRPPSGMMRVEIGGMQAPARAITGPAGRFRVGPVDPDKSYKVKATAEGFAPSRESVTGLEPRRTKKGVSLTLDRGRAVTGRVVDEEGLGLRDVTVRLEPQRSRGGMGMMRIMDSTEAPVEYLGATDGEGRFRVEGLPDGKFDLEASRPGFAKKSVTGVQVGGEDAQGDLGEIALEPGQRVQGIVTDSAGLPLEGVEVYVSTGGPQMTMVMAGAHPEEPEPEAVTDPNGWFTVQDLSAAEPVTFNFERSGFVDESAKAIELPRLEPLEVKLEAASDISGRVLDGEGEPVSGASVNLRRALTIEMGGAIMKTIMMLSEQTDAEGRFLFADQEPGTIALSAVASGFQEAKLDNVEVPKGEDLTGVEIALPTGAILQGRVLLPDGRPAIKAEVREVEESSEGMFFGGIPTDGNGYYRIEGLVPGKISIEATHESWPRVVRDIEIDEGIHTLDLRFDGGIEVSGLVTDIDGEPVADAAVRLAPVGRYYGGPEAVTGADGRFEMPGVKEGEYDLWVEAFEYAPFPGERRVTVEADPVYGLDVTLDRGGAIAGRVTGLDPEKLGKVSVVAQSTAGRGWNTGTIDSKGRYRIEHLYPGEYNVVARLGDSGRRAKEQVTLDAGVEELSTDLKFDDGLVLSGRVTLDEEPVAGLSVIVEGLDVDRSGWATTGERGGFAVEGLEPGRYQVKLRDWQEGLAHDETLDLSTSREIELEVPTGEVTGLFRDSADRTPLAGVALTLEAENEELRNRVPSHTATTDVEGRFVVRGVADGEWRLSAVKKGYAAVAQKVQLRTGRGADGLDIKMDPTEGMTLETRMPTGAAPDEVRVAVLDPSGAPLVTGVYATGESGRVRLSTVPAGTWDVVVSAAGSATVNGRASAPGEAIPMPLLPPTVLRVNVPELQTSEAVATVTVQDAEGRPFRSLDWSGRPQDDYRMYGGQVEFAALPPGSWSVTVATADGRSWQGQSQTASGSASELVLD